MTFKPGNQYGKLGRPKGGKNRPQPLSSHFVQSLMPGVKRRLRQLVQSKNEDVALRTCLKLLEHRYGRAMTHRVALKHFHRP